MLPDSIPEIGFLGLSLDRTPPTSPNSLFKQLDLGLLGGSLNNRRESAGRAGLNAVLIHDRYPRKHDLYFSWDVYLVRLKYEAKLRNQQIQR